MSQIVFACYSKACAPPPAGKGGSVKGGKVSSRTREEYRSLINQASEIHNDRGIVRMTTGRVSTKWEVHKKGKRVQKGYTLERSAAVQKALDAFLSPN